MLCHDCGMVIVAIFYFLFVNFLLFRYQYKTYDKALIISKREKRTGRMETNARFIHCVGDIGLQSDDEFNNPECNDRTVNSHGYAPGDLAGNQLMNWDTRNS